MVDDGENNAAPDNAGQSADPAALHIAMTSESVEARDYLRKQTELADKQSRLADLQIDTLQKKDEFELSHLRFRRFSDYARFALEIAVGLVVLLIILGLGTMVWNASRDHDLVVDAFSVPPAPRSPTVCWIAWVRWTAASCLSQAIFPPITAMPVLTFAWKFPTPAFPSVNSIAICAAGWGAKPMSAANWSARPRGFR
jgi:hypothetical protein